MSSPAANSTSHPASEPAIPGLFHLDGSRRGTTDSLVSDTVRIGTAANADVHLPADREPAVAAHHATLYRRGNTYRLQVEPDQMMWVNDEPVRDMVLASGDVLQIGEGGPRLRYRLIERGQSGYRSMAEVLSDCVDCAQAAGTSPLDRAGIFLRTAPRDLATKTSPRFRLLSVLMLLLLAASTFGLALRSANLEKRLESERMRVDGIGELLREVDAKALTLAELGEVRAELDDSLTGSLERLEALEERADASRRVISEAAQSVVFLQGSYGFLEPVSGKPLRVLLGPNGQPVVDPAGNPGVTVEGNGPRLESQFTGTGFVATEDGLIVTNRHVAVPWDFDAAASMIVKQGLIPSFFRFVGYLEGVPEPFEVELVSAHDEADVAVLRCRVVASQVRPLPLATVPPQIGDEVIVMGYPTGMRALLARTDANFVSQLMKGGELDFWKVAERLAEAGHIAPLATRGIIGQVTSAAVVYDAETTSGGSGGPVVNLEGEVVAVNMAILPEFGGSNLGAPIATARSLLEPATPTPSLTPVDPGELSRP